MFMKRSRWYENAGTEAGPVSVNEFSYNLVSSWIRYGCSLCGGTGGTG